METSVIGAVLPVIFIFNSVNDIDELQPVVTTLTEIIAWLVAHFVIVAVEALYAILETYSIAPEPEAGVNW